MRANSPHPCVDGPIYNSIKAARDDPDHSSADRTALDARAPVSWYASNGRGPIPGLGPCDAYAVFYGGLDEETLADLNAFDLVILHPDYDVTPSQIAELRAAGIIILVYVSIGEEPPGTPYMGDSLGPVYHAPGQSCAGVPDRRCQHQGVASYYLDEVVNSTGASGHDGLPDVSDGWNSYFVDPASMLWRNQVRSCVKGADACNFYGADYLINTLGVDGLFLDTVDTASPWYHYSYTLEAMADLICGISSWYPRQYVVLNRGVFFADPTYEAGIVHRCINGIVFESYCSEWDWASDGGKISPWCEDNRSNWAPKLNAQAAMTDGYTLFALDYFAPTQQISITNHISEVVRGWGWLDYLSTPYLDTVRWDVWKYYREQDLACVTISGPTRAISGSTYIFTASVKPITTTTPITYFWQVSGGSSITHIGGANDTISFNWDTVGARVLTVTAQNATGKAMDRHTVAVDYGIYLPIVLKNG